MHDWWYNVVCVWVCFALEMGLCFVLRFLLEPFLIYLACFELMTSILRVSDTFHWAIASTLVFFSVCSYMYTLQFYVVIQTIIGNFRFHRRTLAESDKCQVKPYRQYKQVFFVIVRIVINIWEKAGKACTSYWSGLCMQIIKVSSVSKIALYQTPGSRFSKQSWYRSGTSYRRYWYWSFAVC